MSVALLYAFIFPDGNISMSPFQSSVPAILTLNSLIYGLRLASFIFLREQTVESKKKAFKDLDKSDPLKRIPLALGVSLLYAFMTSPALFALREPTLAAGSALEKVQLYSTGVSVFGMILEAIADQVSLTHCKIVFSPVVGPVTQHHFCETYSTSIKRSEARIAKINL